MLVSNRYKSPNWNWGYKQDMNDTNTKQKIEVMTAYLDGKIIQYTERGRSQWFSTNNTDHCEPLWAWQKYDYRIETVEPKKPILLSVADLPLGIKTITLVFVTYKAIVVAWNEKKDSLCYYLVNQLVVDTIEELHNRKIKWSLDGGKTALSFEKYDL